MKKLFLLFLGLLMLLGSDLYAQTLVTVSGTVRDSQDNETLTGATVIAQGGSYVMTNVDGAYVIKVAPGTLLTYRFFGYTTAQFTCPLDSLTVTHNVMLVSESLKADDLVVVGYSERKKGTITGSVSTVKAGKVADVPTAGFDQALQGQVAGLSVLSNSGEPSSSAVLQIRGVNSINSGTSPLFILDGVPISSTDFNMINPADIESISVLKDASSTSIYGARAANGVVVVTTKRGKMQKNAQVTFRSQFGISKIASGNWNQMNTTERIAYEKEVGLDAGINYDLIKDIDINWLDEVFRNNAKLNSYDLQVTGANDKVNYFISGGYFSQEGIATDSDFKRYTLRTNLSFRANDFLRFGTNTMLAYEDFSRSTAGSYAVNTPIAGARFMMPYWNPYNADGSLASVNDGTWKGVGQNPLEWAANNPFNQKRSKVISTIFADVNLAKGLKFRSTLGLDFSFSNAKANSMPSYKPNNNSGSISRTASDSRNIINTNQLDYAFDIDGIHRFNIMLAQEGIDYHGEGFGVNSRGQTNDQLMSLTTGTTTVATDDYVSEYSSLSYFTKGEYNYDGRYFVDVAIRRDGSSRFGKDNRWGTFWSVGGMWNMHHEEFMASTKSWLDQLQIAASIGTSGNSSIPNYDHLALVLGGLQYQQYTGLAPYSKGNEKLGWEQLLTTNLAVRARLFDRISFEAEVYNKVTSNMLMLVPVSMSDAGYDFRWDNVGEMVNRGVELNLNADVVVTKDFKWNINANVSYNHNEITKLYAGLNEYNLGTTGTKLAVGHSSSEFFLNRFAGVNAANGDPLWYTKDGEITNEYRDEDKVLVGKSFEAPWQGGFGMTFTWKSFMFTTQFSWVADKWMLNNDRYFEENSQISGVYNQSKRMLYDRWKNPGDITDIPRYGTSQQFDTHLLEDASFLRLKNVMLSYTLPRTVMSKLGFLQSARVFVQGQNLLTFTKFSGLDPESSTNLYKAQYPMSQQITFGAEITF